MIQRPKNITDNQWQQAVELYNKAKEKGDAYPELTVAQAALETGWFKSPSGSYNYFGQKASSKQKGSIKNTTEVAGNSSYKTQAKFRDYSSLDDAVEDRINKWGSKYKDAKTVDEAISKIWQYDPKTGQGKGYATDINYGSKLKTILGSLGVESNKGSTNQQEQQSSLEYVNHVAGLDTNLPQGAAITFSGDKEETKTEGEKAVQLLNEENFLEDYADLQYQQAQQEVQQPYQEQAMVAPLEVTPIEYAPPQLPEQQFQKGGEIPVSSRGVYDYPMQKVIVPTEDGNITMKGVDYPIIGIDEFGNSQMMQPNQDYKFKGKTVLEIPQFKK